MKRKYKTPFNASKVCRLIEIDPCTGLMTWKIRPEDMFPNIRSAKVWNSRYSGRSAMRNPGKNGYYYGYILGEMMVAHRVAWAAYYGEWPDMDIDHIDGNRKNNSKSNLRLLSRQDNLRNRGKCRRNTSGVVGVYWHKAARKWRAFIKVGDKQVHLGLFEEKEKAVIARKKAEEEFGFFEGHGERDAYHAK